MDFSELYYDLLDDFIDLEAELNHLKEEYQQLVQQVENLPEDLYNKYIAEIE